MIQARGLSKSYGGTLALRSLDLDIAPGEVHAICGENGAGKSTLNKILAGIITPEAGSVTIDGAELSLGSPAAAESAGIAIVYQESAAFLHLDAAENHQIMREPGGLWMNRKQMAERTNASLAKLGESFDLDRPLADLSVAQRQMVAIARALSGDCRLLILDEPTSSLSSRESESLFAAVRSLRERGVAVLYVSHRMEEIFALADRVTVLRDGAHVATKTIADTSRDDLIRLMVGRDVEFERREALPPGSTLLKAEKIERAGAFKGVSLELGAGEVVCLAGLVGAGRSEVARALFGLDPIDSGNIECQARVALVPEDRQREGLHLPLSIRDNLAMAQTSGAIVNRAAESQRATATIDRLSIKTRSAEAPASSLSGGNQQKVLLGKWLATEPTVLLLDEPTRGVDVGAKDQIHRLIGELAADGAAILVISSELPEVLALADRVIVMRQGEIAGELTRDQATQESILELALQRESEAQAESTTKKRFPRETGIGALLLAMIAFAGIVNPAFLAGGNLMDMLVKVAPAIIVGVAMTLVILAREIDISVGSLMGLCAATLGIAVSPDRMGLPVAVGVMLCLGVGLLGGLVNGLLVAKARIPSIIVTLGMLTVLKGVTERMMGGKWIESLPGGVRAFGVGNLAGVPNVVWMAILTVAIGVWITRRTPFGLRTYAVGSDPAAATLRGVPVDRVRIALFALSGLAAGVAALFSATQLQVIESGFGSGFELVVIASVIVGGTSIRGGQGSIWGTVLGASLLGIVSTVLIFLKLGDSAVYWERAIQGMLILLAVVGDSLWRRRRA